MFTVLRILQFNLQYSSLNVKLLSPSYEKYYRFMRHTVSCMFFDSPFVLSDSNALTAVIC